MGKVMGICISEKRGTQKKRIDKANFIQDFGIENDAHAGKWHRQVSLLSYEKIEDFKAKGAEINDGAFGENIIVQGFNLKALPIGSVLTCGNIILEITQIGKECHAHCEIYKKMGECIMPTNGVFAKVIEGGQMKIGDEIEIASGIVENVLK
ncbi:MOSC domain-containing protein [Clostridium botulinum]|uniref:MOSC domain-containing protein n=1 Tax=Clostridium botulinum TaxID=1491 RepID=UPI0013F13592|nr:MOSC domain-containing protein [Clostridium botulinum]MBY6836111.1 MOSC domain-containing protein [Clostridium botulinum]NFG24628.1 MOSC domain-containing protein [Clostridium botulinum]NFG66354.1 MOSC domain-containing protein [Clostridium botulinum]NFO02881.1 MOSC domain-containing protein [Clostridium botulinum]NFO12841.1 MOSC domain-containing protein [Clostridium botulinum]